MIKIIYTCLLFIITAAFLSGCAYKEGRNNSMISLLEKIEKSQAVAGNFFASAAKLKFYDSLLASKYLSMGDSFDIQSMRAGVFLELGEEQEAVIAYESLLNRIPAFAVKYKLDVLKAYAMACLRLGERTNCVHNHSAESCIFPIARNGVHINKDGSQKAIEVFQTILQLDSADLESRWLLNIAYMTTGGYPQQVPAAWLIKGLDADTSSALVKPFADIAMNVGINTSNMAGGSITEDFNNDGYMDIVSSNWQLGNGMHYCQNNGDGTFTDLSETSGLGKINGGLHIVETDYNNDGLKDIFVLRGAWKAAFGNEPNSLLQNNGDGTFTDVTEKAGLLSFHPTQTATWADFNNDGWLDVFIGNESTEQNKHPCELYMSNKNGTFTEVAASAGCSVSMFVKGVTSADYDNDGLTDIFISTMNGNKVLLKNEGVKNGTIHFADVTVPAGLAKNVTRTFPTWFWDYDNDGWQDIVVCGYDFGKKSLAWFAAAEALQIPTGNSGKVFLFRNKHDGSFEEVTEQAGLNKMAFAMGCNFGDIDNDGYPDMYLGTGNPQFQSLVPNKMFKNMGGKSFADITTAAHVGNLQKGHGVCFADLDNDGDEDIYIEMGGAVAGDKYTNSLFLNPGQNTNHWITLNLEGVTCNKAAIGAKIKLTFRENNVERCVYKNVNSGGSFGSNPLAQHIGIGKATVIDKIEITWPGSNTIQHFENVQPNEYLKITQGIAPFKKIPFIAFKFSQGRPAAIGCGPASFH